VLFERFGAAFGAQKVGAMWPIEKHEQMRALWAEQLGRFAPDTLRAACQAVIDSGMEWPPTLPEFVELCRQSAVGRQNAQAIGYTQDVTPQGEALQNVGRVKSLLSRVGEAGRRDPLHWAKHPKSLQAVMLLVRGAKTDNRLRDILRSHVEDAGDRMPNNDALRYFTVVLERDHSLLTAECETPTR
jgi:hypothetical protein